MRLLKDIEKGHVDGPYANLLVQQVGTLLNIPSCEKYGNFVVQGLVKHGNDLDKDAAA